MLERTEIDGRKATVAYLTTDFELTNKKDAVLAKVSFDDGDTMIIKRRKTVEESDDGEET